MAIYHCEVKLIKRSKGKSSVACASYRAGQKLHDDRTGLTHDYSKKDHEIYSEILAPINSPEWVYDRSELWNTVEKVENRKDAQVSREVLFALPGELNREQQLGLLKSYVNDNFVSKGMVADINIHYKEGNPHAHIMLTTREISAEGFGKKNRDWNNRDLVKEWRKSWEIYQNEALENAGYSQRVDCRSLAEKGIDKVPQIHLGPNVKSMAEKGIETDKYNLYKEIEELNKEKVVVLQEYKKLKEEIQMLENDRDKEGYMEHEISKIEEFETRIHADVSKEFTQYYINQTQQEISDYTRKLNDVGRDSEYAAEYIDKIEEYKEKLELAKEAEKAFSHKELRDTLSSYKSQDQFERHEESLKNDVEKYQDKVRDIKTKSNTLENAGYFLEEKERAEKELSNFSFVQKHFTKKESYERLENSIQIYKEELNKLNINDWREYNQLAAEVKDNDTLNYYQQKLKDTREELAVITQAENSFRRKEAEKDQEITKDNKKENDNSQEQENEGYYNVRER